MSNVIFDFSQKRAAAKCFGILLLLFLFMIEIKVMTYKAL